MLYPLSYGRERGPIVSVSDAIVGRRVSIGCLLVLLASLGAHAENAPPSPFAGFETQVLANGLKVWYKRTPGQPVAALSVAVQVGADADPAGQEELAHFLEHVQFGDHLGLSGKDIKKQIEDRGGVWNGYTGSDRTFYFVHIGKEHGLFALDWLHRIVSLHALGADVVALERRPVEIEVGARPRELFDWIEARYVNPPALRLPGFWTREFGLVTRESVDYYPYRSLHAITPDDLRRFYDRYYSATQMTVTVIGDLDRTAVFDAIGASFAKLRGLPPPPAPAVHDSGRRRSSFWWSLNSDIWYSHRVRFASLTADDELRLMFIGRLLEKRLNDRLRFGDRKAVYGLASAVVKRGPAAYFSIQGYVQRSEFDFARHVVDDQLDALRAGTIPDDEFEADRATVVQQLRVSNSKPEDLEAWVWNHFFDRRRRLDFPDLVAEFQRLQKPAVAEFVTRHFVAAREVREVVYPLPLPQGVVAIVGLAVAFGTVKAVRYRLVRPVAMARIRYVARLRMPIPLSASAALSWFAVTAASVRLLVYAYVLFNDRFLVGIDSFAARALLYALMFSSILGALVVALALIPRKLLLFDDRILIKCYAYRSVAVPLNEVGELSLRRFREVWLSSRLWRCVPLTFGLFSPGIYLRLGHGRGRAYFFDVRDRDEFLHAVQRAISEQAALVPASIAVGDVSAVAGRRDRAGQ